MMHPDNEQSSRRMSSISESWVLVLLQIHHLGKKDDDD